jgi:hypothetical protein
MNLANKLRETTKNAIDTAEVDRLFMLIIKKCEKEANRGNTECNADLWDGMKQILNFNEYSKSDAFLMAIVEKLEEAGLNTQWKFGAGHEYLNLSWK